MSPADLYSVSLSFPIFIFRLKFKIAKNELKLVNWSIKAKAVFATLKHEEKKCYFFSGCLLTYKEAEVRKSSCNEMY